MLCTSGQLVVKSNRKRPIAPFIALHVNYLQDWHSKSVPVGIGGAWGVPPPSRLKQNLLVQTTRITTLDKVNKHTTLVRPLPPDHRLRGIGFFRNHSRALGESWRGSEPLKWSFSGDQCPSSLLLGTTKYGPVLYTFIVFYRPLSQ